MLMKGSGLPESEADPVIKILFSLIGCIEGETIGAGMLQGFAAVHSFAQDEKGEGASLLIGAVSGDFLHVACFLEVSPIFPLAPLPQFFRKKRKGKKKKRKQSFPNGTQGKSSARYGFFLNEIT